MAEGRSRSPLPGLRLLEPLTSVPECRNQTVRLSGRDAETGVGHSRRSEHRVSKHALRAAPAETSEQDSQQTEGVMVAPSAARLEGEGQGRECVQPVLSP